METLKTLSNTFMLTYSPLDQFDNVSFNLFNVVFESSDFYALYVFELEYDLISLFTNNGNNAWVFGQGHLICGLGNIALITYYWNVKMNEVAPQIKKQYEGEFFMLSFIIFLQILAVLPLSLWFADSILMTSIESGDKKLFNLEIIPQINFSFNIDEAFVTLLAAFLFIGGAEEEEDESFILEEEESDFVEDIVAPLYLSNLGKDVQDNAALYLKLNAVFSFVLYNNLIGMIPYSDTATSSLILTFWVALSVFGSLIYILLKMHGVNYFFALFMPSGSPLALAFLLIPIEFISYVFRVVSLSVRLFANMFAGHTLLKVIVGFSWSMLLLGDVFLIINLFPMAILFLLTFLEIGVAIVQAYIFTTLTALYLKDLFVAH